jgi:hypothetical protein
LGTNIDRPYQIIWPRSIQLVPGTIHNGSFLMKEDNIWSGLHGPWRFLYNWRMEIRRWSHLPPCAFSWEKYVWHVSNKLLDGDSTRTRVAESRTRCELGVLWALPEGNCVGSLNGLSRSAYDTQSSTIGFVWRNWKEAMFYLDYLYRSVCSEICGVDQWPGVGFFNTNGHHMEPPCSISLDCLLLNFILFHSCSNFKLKYYLLISNHNF